MLQRLRFQNLPLFWKILLPFTTLVAVVGAAGVFFIVRDLSSRAQSALEAELGRRALDSKATIASQELFLLESANLAANLEGMPGAVAGEDVFEIKGLLRSVLALKPDLSLVAVTDRSGSGIVSLAGKRAGAPFPKSTNWARFDPISDALAGRRGERASGYVTAGGRPLLVVTAPICRSPDPCRPLGAAITGIDPRKLISPSLSKRTDGGKVALFDRAGDVITGSAGSLTAYEPPVGDRTMRTVGSGDREMTILYTPVQIQNRRVGTLAVAIPTSPALAVVRAAATRLALVVLGTMVGIFVLGALISRTIVARVQRLLQTNAAIARGDLAARAPAESLDELGALAAGVNSMAEQLQASYETLELRVAQRTEEVQRLLKDRTEFFASLSHELRTPLAVILGEVKLLERERSQSAKALGLSAEQLLEVVNNILDLARADSEGIELVLEDVNVPEFIAELRPTLDGLAKGSGLAMELDLHRDPPPVVADRARLREIILNLVDNAVKYTP
ncbi:MAG TPA: histidine kinase dimerization/phospho-acceptor domain-containing protein, partial [Actinomycetota bacterium]|nr:histidine kinase dimerization/phospho-acceptor domain-containing protein [Actinomycetota bacterium]